MGMLLSYSIYSAILLTLLYLTYKWMLSGENQHKANRAILLSIYAVAMGAMPAGTWLRAVSAAGASGAGDVAVELPVAGPALEPQGHIVADVILWIYLTGMVAVVFHTVMVWVRLARLVRGGRRSRCGRYTLVITTRTGIAPFSWWRYIVMSEADYAEAGDMIICHESRHLDLLHPLDLLLAQAVAIVEWWNPAAWLMREELRTVHEYQADSRVLASGINAREYQMLLIKKAVGARFPSLANSLNHSKLKKRITMMYNQKMSARRRMRALALVPALGVAIAVTNLPAVASAMSLAGSSTLAGMPAMAADPDGKVSTNPESGQTVYDTVETMPEFPGGVTALIAYLGANTQYPAEAEQRGIEGRVVVKFVVGADGKVGDVDVIRPVDKTLDAEAVRVVRSLPSFTPGKMNGRPVAVYYTLPVQFRLKGDNEAATPAAGESKGSATVNGKPISVLAAGDAVVKVDGRVVSAEELKAIDPSRVKSMSVDKSGDKPVISVTLND